MEPTILNSPRIYNGAGVYNTGANGGGGDNNLIGKDYKTIKVNGITWLAENLNYRFSGGKLGITGQPSNPAYAYYDNDDSVYDCFGTRNTGLLYNWYAVKFLEDNKHLLCPGWHVPTIDEWRSLINYFGGAASAGKKLKKNGVNWAPSWGGTNESEFSVLPGGSYYGSFVQITTYARFWTIDTNGSNAGLIRFSQLDDVVYDYDALSNAFSLRLVKD